MNERWDIVLVVLDGPSRSSTPHVVRGPLVPIGSSPGPGGFRVVGVGGLHARHCVLQAYGPVTTLDAVGANPVRIAPHPHVDWSTIEPIHGSVPLSAGCALHLGPIGRGVTLQYVGSRSLADWTPDSLGTQGVSAVPTSSVPAWFLGCAGLSLGTTALSLLVLGLAVAIGYRPVEPLGPTYDDRAYYPSIPKVRKPDAKLLKDLEQPLYQWVMLPNREAAEDLHPTLDDPASWDPVFVAYVTRSVELHVRQRPFFQTLDSRREEWAITLTELRKAGLPEVFAAIPYQEALYDSRKQSIACAKGAWQFMPETATRVHRVHGSPLEVRDCRLRGRSERWSPKDLAPPVSREAVYIEDDRCLITSCGIDDRTDLRKSTAGAVHTLKEAWDHPEIQASGAAVQLTILSHNAGLDDRPYGHPKRSNVLPAYHRWREASGTDPSHHFYGANIRCDTHLGKDTCGSRLMPETQHYAYNIVAQHILAVCYYSQEYSHLPAFEPWATWALKDSYCEQFDIPTKQEVQAW